MQSLLLKRIDLATAMATTPPPIDMVLDGLPLGALGVVLGAGGVGKSMMMLSVTHAVSTGIDTLGCLLPDIRVTEYGRVVYLAGEDDDIIWHHRVHAYARVLDEDARKAMSERIDIIPLVGSAPTLLDGAGAINDEAMTQIRECAKNTRLLIIDPLRQFHSAGENDNGAMTILSKAIAKIAHEEKCAIVLVHHTSKAGAKDDDGDASVSRGASAITDNARWVMALKKLSEKAMEDHGLLPPAWRYVTTRKVKSNYAALGDVTILERGDGGILEPTMVRPRDIVREVVEQIGSTVDDDNDGWTIG